MRKDRLVNLSTADNKLNATICFVPYPLFLIVGIYIPENQMQGGHCLFRSLWGFQSSAGTE
jgi:hypothetical protein